MALRTGFISDSDVVVVELQRVVVDLLAWTAFQGKAINLGVIKSAATN